MRLLFYAAKLFERLHLPAVRNSKLEPHAKICSGARVYDTKLGECSYIGRNCTVVNAQIGRFCSIADGCVIGGAQHRVDYVSTSPVFHSGRNCMGKHYSEHPAHSFPETVIGNDVWVGNHVLIKGGVRIGNGAVIGMGSVVTHDVPDYEIWAGVPAHRIKDRFDEQTREKLLASSWWNWSEEKLFQAAKYFANPKQFCDYLEEEVE